MFARIILKDQALDLLDSEVIIGREGDFFQIDDATVSRRHFKLCKDGVLFYIYDLKSKSGTFVNDQKVPSRGLLLPDYATIRSGETVFTFVNSVEVKIDTETQGETQEEDISSSSQDISIDKIWQYAGPCALVYSISTMLLEKNWKDHLVKVELLKLIANYLKTPELIILKSILEEGNFEVVATFRRATPNKSTPIIVQKNIVAECLKNKRALIRQTGKESILCIPIVTQPMESVLYMKRPSSPFNKNEIMVCGAVAHLISSNDKQQKFQRKNERSQKLETVGMVVAGIVHSFNNVLGGIMGNMELLVEEMEADKVQLNYKEYIDNIQTALNDALSLTRDILSHSREIETEMIQLDVGKLLQNIHKIYHPTLPRHIDFTIATHAKEIYVKGNQSQLTQAILNVIRNASQAISEDKGSIVVSCFINHQQKNIPELSTEKKYFCITIADTGKGMDQETLKRIFAPFFTTKLETEGTGLGLFYSLAIIKRHGGNITAQSTMENGSKFHIFLPLSSGITDPVETLYQKRATVICKKKETIYTIRQMKEDD